MSLKVYSSKHCRKAEPQDLVCKCKNICMYSEGNIGALWPQQRRVWESKLPSGSQAVKCPFLSLELTHWPDPQGHMTFVKGLFGPKGSGALPGSPLLLDPHYPAAPRVLYRPWSLLILLIHDWMLTAEMALVCDALTAFNLTAASKACTDGAFSIIFS